MPHVEPRSRQCSFEAAAERCEDGVIEIEGGVDEGGADVLRVVSRSGAGEHLLARQRVRRGRVDGRGHCSRHCGMGTNEYKRINKPEYFVCVEIILRSPGPTK